MICSRRLAFAMSLLWGMLALSYTLPVYSESRGELLYLINCKACHTSKVHWRKEKLATDWLSLKVQVTRWQRNMDLGWGEDEITDVTRYLNTNYYYFKVTNKNDIAAGNK